MSVDARDEDKRRHPYSRALRRVSRMRTLLLRQAVKLGRAKAMTTKTEAAKTEVVQLPVRRELAAGAPLRAIIPTTMEEAFRIANAVVKAGMAPQGMQTAEKCLIAIMQGLEVGMTPMQSIQRIAVIGGRPTIYGDAAIGLVRASGLCEYVSEWIVGEGDERVAHCETKRRGETKVVTASFSVQDAVVAKLWKKDGPWQTHPKRMLQMRARGFTLRDAYADVLGGMYLREEVEGEDDMRDVTPKPSTPLTSADRPKSLDDMMQTLADTNFDTPEPEPEPETKKPKSTKEGGLRYAPELSASNAAIMVGGLDEIESPDALAVYAESYKDVFVRLTPEDQSMVEKQLLERANALLPEGSTLTFDK